MTNIIAIKVHCNDCDMEYEVKYDDDDFVRPSHCVGCGNKGTMVEEEI